MLISNLLLIPGTGDIASEIFHALRYEKTVRLYAANVDTVSDEYQIPPHRMTPLSPLPNWEAPEFLEAFRIVLARVAIDYIVPTTAEARNFFQQHPDLAPVLDTTSGGIPPDIQEEASVIFDCCTDGKYVPIYIGARRKTMGADGKHNIWQTIPVTDEQRKLLAETSNQYCLSGAWSVSVDQNGKLHTLTPAFAPEMGIYRALGVNFMLLMLHAARSNPVSTLPINASAKLHRATQSISLELDFKTVFLDMDDTLISHGSINDSVSAFIYHCRAHNIPVHLITRHYRKPAITLCEFGIAEDLFASIIWIEDKTPKSAFMRKADKPLFIDDAFSERLAVSSKTDIFCLPPEAVETLMVNL